MRLPKGIAAILGASVFGGVANKRVSNESPANAMIHSTATGESPKHQIGEEDKITASLYSAGSEPSPKNDDKQSQRNTQESSSPENASSNDDLRSLKQQLRLLMAVRCLRSAHLAQPLLVPFYSQSLGLTPTSVLWLGSFYSALVTIAELPSGILSDRLGRKATLHIAFLGFAACLLITALVSTTPILNKNWLMWTFLGFAQFARAIGSSLYSGTDMAFLYELLRKYDIAKGDSLLLSIESRNVFYTTATESCMAAFGGWLSGLMSLPTIVVLSSIPFGVGAILTLFLDSDLSHPSDKEKIVSKEACSQEMKHQQDGRNDEANGRRQSFARRASFITLPSISPIYRSIRNGFRFHWTMVQDFVPAQLRTLFVVGVVLNCGTYLAASAINPLLWETVGIPVGHFGSLHAGCGATAASGALLAPVLRRNLQWRKNSTEGLLLFLLGTSALAYALVGLSSTMVTSASLGFAILASLLLSLVRGLAWPVLGSAINASVDENGSRATTLSLFSGAVKVGMVITGMIMGALFQSPETPAGADGNNDHNSIRNGLVQGSAMCFVTLIATFGWLAGTGISVMKPTGRKLSNEKSE